MYFNRHTRAHKLNAREEILASYYNLNMERENKDNSRIFDALDKNLSLDVVKNIVDGGADISVKRRVFERYYEYPLTLAIAKGLPIEYIKILYNTFVPPVHIISILNISKSPDETVEFLLEKIDEYLAPHIPDDSQRYTYTKQWKESKCRADFWSEGIPESIELSTEPYRAYGAAGKKPIALGLSFKNRSSDTPRSLKNLYEFLLALA